MKISVYATLALTCALALQQLGCESAGTKTAEGAGIGAAAGGLLGAVVGNQSGNAGKGALVGAVLGAGLGGLVGNRLDRQAKELEKVAETKRTDQGLITKLKSDILFEKGQANLKPAAIVNIGQLAAILKKYPENVITVRGYTDSTGSKAANDKVSAARAEAVKTQLIAGGVPAASITVVGMGPQNPVADNATEAGRSQNRRVEIEVTADSSKLPKNAS